MELLFPLLLLLLPLLISLLLLKRLRNQKRDGRKKNLPPGPWGLPVIGNLHQLSSMPHHSLLSLSQKHGPIMFLRLGRIPTLVVSSGDALKAIFPSHDVVFSSRPVLQAGKKFSFNNSNISFSPYGENWRQARKLCVLEMLSSRRVRSFQSVRAQEVAMLSAAIKKLSSSSSNSPINLSEMVFALLYNLTCRVVFGDQNGSGAGVYQGQRSWIRGLMVETQELNTGFYADDFFPGWGWIDVITGQRARLGKNFEMIRRFFEQVIDQHLKRAKDGEDDRDRHEEDLVDVLLKVHSEVGGGGFLCTMDYVKGIMGDLFFGATDTTSATIIWTMTELIRNPRVMAKLHQQIEDVVGNKGWVEETELEQLDYLKLVIKEALRLHPSVPLLVPRETLESCKIEGYDIPAKTRVFINAVAIGRDPNIWKNPDEFWPERFAFPDPDSKGQEFNYVPFGIGRRSCPGVNFANVVMELVLANMLHCFDWCLPDGMNPKDIDMTEAPGLTVNKKEPLCVVARSKK